MAERSAFFSPFTSTNRTRNSGVILPLVLRRALKQSKAKDEKTETETTPAEAVHTGNSKQLFDRFSNRIFTADELEEELKLTSQAIVSLEKQIQCGEETYFDETYSHGNIFQQWDGFIDAREIGGSISAADNSSNAASASAGSIGSGAQKRMPADHRWMSNSCACWNTRHLRAPQNFFAPVSGSIHLSKMSNIQSAAKKRTGDEMENTDIHNFKPNDAMPKPESKETKIAVSPSSSAKTIDTTEPARSKRQSKRIEESGAQQAVAKRSQQSTIADSEQLKPNGSQEKDSEGDSPEQANTASTSNIAKVKTPSEPTPSEPAPTKAPDLKRKTSSTDEVVATTAHRRTKRKRKSVT